MTNDRQSFKSADLMTQFIFSSRWLQAPLYVGLIVTQGVYIFKFLGELYHLLQVITTLGETEFLLIVLGLIDVVMVSNLLIMIIIGGYETFVSRLHLRDHPDMPEWLDHINANTMKIKLSTALVGISSVHLLKTFFNLEHMTDNTVFWQVVIHTIFLFSSMALAFTAKMTVHNE